MTSVKHCVICKATEPGTANGYWKKPRLVHTTADRMCAQCFKLMEWTNWDSAKIRALIAYGEQWGIWK